MAQPPQPKYLLTDLTILAEKFGHPIGPLHDAISYQFPFKSGLTPLPDPPFATDEESLDFLGQEAYQRAMIDCWGDKCSGRARSDVRSDTDILSKWDKPLRRHLAKYPLGGGRPGYWEGSNPIVWNAILPALRMASLFLSNSHFWPWWDALMAGKYDKIPHDNVPELYKVFTYKKFTRRDPVVAGKPEEYDKLQAVFLQICSNVDLQFMSARARSDVGVG
ncbi:hypothetical protein BKA65DRAFT_473640 [Rhexocercosporidium sp. MPI-PUGE-AT-0058]|nr:hypothetical protein BKA65DRAFT_473640 [Rhexocercosporidium sp. MPI-PUGE-AT-0058]